MAQITISRANVLSLLGLCTRAASTTFFLAKDSGAYIGQNFQGSRVLFYFKGCDPTKDADYYDNSRRMFGGDDFGIMLPVQWLQKVADSAQVAKMQINVTSRKVSAKYLA